MRRLCGVARTGVAVAIGLSTVLLHARDASAQATPDRSEEGELVWREHWPRFHWAEYATTGVLIGGTILAGVFGPSNVVFWSDGNEFDDHARGGLRVDPPQQSSTAIASDVLLGALMAYPYVDAGVAWLGHGSADVAWQMAMINTESLAVSMAITTGIKFAAGRMRPNARECLETGRGDDPECTGDDYASSFFSGHSAMAFTGAGLTCAHHTNLPLYGGGAPDYLACATALGAATATGLLRVNADRHYVSDVIVGGLVGSISGYVLPNLLHYRFGAEPAERASKPSDTRVMVTPLGGDSFAGLGAVGMF